MYELDVAAAERSTGVHFRAKRPPIHSCARTKFASALLLAGLWMLLTALITRDVLADEASELVSGVPFSRDNSAESDRTHLVVKTHNLFWSDSSETPVNVISVNGGLVTNLATKMGVPQRVAVNGQNIYWIETRSGASPSGCGFGAGVTKLLRKKSLDGSETTLAEGDNCTPFGNMDVVFDSSNIYWETASGESTYIINKVPLDGGTSSAIATRSTQILAMATDGKDLYWEEGSTPSPGSIFRMPLGGGAVSSVYASPQNPFVGGFVIRKSQIFFADQVSFANASVVARLLEIPVSGGPVTVLSNLAAVPINLAADDDNVYWIDAGSVNAVPLDGGEVTTLAGGLNSPAALVVGPNSLFWTETVCCAHGQKGSIKSIPTTGGSISVLADGVDAPGPIAVDTSNVYLGEVDQADIEGFGRIASVPLTGGTVTTVASGVSSNLVPIAVDDKNVYIADKFTIKKVPIIGGTVEKLAGGDFYVQSIATDGTWVYWDEGPAVIVRKVSVNGGAITNLAGGSGQPGPIALDSGNVYWTDNFNIYKVSINGGTAVTIAANLPFLSDMTTDGINVYFSETDTGEIAKLPVNGGPITSLPGGLHFSWNILALDDVNLYWADQLRVGQIPKAGGNASFLAGVEGDVVIANAVAGDDQSVFWTDVTAGTINQLDLEQSASITVTVPNGGESWTIGTPKKIQWTSSGFRGKVTIDLSRDGGSSWTKILRTVTDDRVQKWRVSKLATNHARIRVCSVKVSSICDASDSDFAIVPKSH